MTHLVCFCQNSVRYGSFSLCLSFFFKNLSQAQSLNTIYRALFLVWRVAMALPAFCSAICCCSNFRLSLGKNQCRPPNIILRRIIWDINFTVVSLKGNRIVKRTELVLVGSFDQSIFVTRQLVFPFKSLFLPCIVLKHVSKLSTFLYTFLVQDEQKSYSLR